MASSNSPLPVAGEGRHDQRLAGVFRIGMLAVDLVEALGRVLELAGVHVGQALIVEVAGRLVVGEGVRGALGRLGAGRQANQRQRQQRPAPSAPAAAWSPAYRTNRIPVARPARLWSASRSKPRFLAENRRLRHVSGRRLIARICGNFRPRRRRRVQGAIAGEIRPLPDRWRRFPAPARPAASRRSPSIGMAAPRPRALVGRAAPPAP